MAVESVFPRAFTVHFKDLVRWDIKTARAVRFYREHPSLRPLSEFAEEATEIVRPWVRGDQDWPVYGVNNETGVFRSHLQRGEAFNAPYKRIRKDWFFHNPTRANVGSLGRVPDVPEDAVTSPEYQVWRIRRGITPDFMELLLRLPFFLEQVEFHRVGAVKERLFVQNLLEIRIPVLPETRQIAIVAHWRNAQEAAAKSRETVAALDAATVSEFFSLLGLTSPKRQKSKKSFAVCWIDLLRWSVSYNQAKLTSVDLLRGRYSVALLGSVLNMVQYGTSQKANIERKGIAVVRMNNIKDGLLELVDLKHVELGHKELQKLLLRDGDILFNRTNSKELVGKCAVFHELTECVFASYLMRVRAKLTLAHPDYLSYFLNCPLGRQQIDALSRHIIGQANINSEELRSIAVCLPPLVVQQKIVEMVNEKRARIAEVRKAVEERQAQAIREVEEMILGVRRVG